MDCQLKRTTVPSARTPAALCTGQVVIVAGRPGYWLHRIVAWATGWWWVHAFVIVDEDRAVEATWPKVREFSVSERLAQYRRQGQEYVVLDYEHGYDRGDRPLSIDERHGIGVQARSYIGRWYNLFSIVWYLFFRAFNRTGGGKHPFCSRLVTASYRQGAKIDLTAGLEQGVVLNLAKYERLNAMRDGYVTPAEILFYLGFRKAEDAPEEQAA